MQYRDCLLFCKLKAGALYAQRKFLLPKTGICSVYPLNTYDLALQPLSFFFLKKKKTLETNLPGIIKDF